MNKQEQIATQLAKPLQVGNDVDIRVFYLKSVTTGKGKKMVTSQESAMFQSSGTIKKIINNPIHGICYEVDGNSASLPSEAQLPSKDFEGHIFTSKIYKAVCLTQSTFHCGTNPFKPRLRVRFISSAIEGLLMKGGYGRRLKSLIAPNYTLINSPNSKNEEKLVGKTYGGINFNPYVLNAKREKIYYQRELVWTVEQKQALIHSIYNGIEIGKFIFKYNDWNNIEMQMLETGHAFNFDCIDGKQRYHAILDFVQNKFPDEFGNYYQDLSEHAQLTFMNYDNFAFGEMEEKASYEDILNTFLTLNFMGEPMSKEHIEYVQSIKLK